MYHADVYRHLDVVCNNDRQGAGHIYTSDIQESMPRAFSWCIFLNAGYFLFIYVLIN